MPLKFYFQCKAMMPVFVINLDKDVDRLSHMAAGLARIGVNWNRFSAIPKDSVDEYREQLAWPLFFSQCRPAEIACSLSHWSVWHKILESRAPYGVVFEDDVIFSKNAAEVLDSIARFAAETDFDVIKLETMLAGIVVSRSKTRLTSNTYATRLIGNHGGCAAYVISKAGCIKMIARMKTAVRAVDFLLFDTPGDVVFQVQPAPCVQDMIINHRNITFKSNIGSGRAENMRNRNSLREYLKTPARPFIRFLVSLRLRSKRQRKIKSVFAS